jgi:hypothetical protein
MVGLLFTLTGGEEVEDRAFFFLRLIFSLKPENFDFSIPCRLIVRMNLTVLSGKDWMHEARKRSVTN